MGEVCLEAWGCGFLMPGVCPLVGEAGLEATASLLVGGLGPSQSQGMVCPPGGWTRSTDFRAAVFFWLVSTPDGEAGPEARASSVEGVARIHGILGMVPAPSWLELGLRFSSWRALRVSGLVPVHWSMGPCLGPSDGQDHVQRWL